MVTKEKKHGWICLTLWAILIVAGIIGKRVFDHPDLVVFFHVPAAVMLVLGWYLLSGEVRRRYAEVCRQRFSAGTSRPRQDQEFGVVRSRSN